MGRYYNGDIEGKFAFGVQPSNDADFFGVMGTEPSVLEYYFDETNLEDINEGIKKCENQLGEYKDKLDYFFKAVNGFNDEIVKDWFKKTYNEDMPSDKFEKLYAILARLELGIKIRDCVQKNGECQFTAEC
jgi:predicted DNA-binding protein YlxM (UPF0122 family)